MGLNRTRFAFIRAMQQGPKLFHEKQRLQTQIDSQWRWLPEALPMRNNVRTLNVSAYEDGCLKLFHEKRLKTNTDS